MFRNYLVTALRNMARHRLHSFINIAGLAVGLACVIFVSLFIRDELSYDEWIPDTQNLYRVEKTSYLLGREPFAVGRAAPFAMLSTMRDEIPEVKAMTRLNYNFMTLFAGDRQFLENVAEVDTNFFRVIKLPLIKGEPGSIFKDPNSLVLSESAARKYFGTSDAIGKFIRTTANCEVTDTECLGRLVPLKVTGIMRDIPYNSHFDGDVFMPNTSIADRIGESAKQSWSGGGSNFGYVVLAPGARPETVAAKMVPVFDRVLEPQVGDNRKGSQRWAIHLTPFTDVHLASGQWRFNQKQPGNRATLYGVGIVGLLVLFVACFNFMNLATAQASLRAREIALRKTLGANRAQLIVQFLGEAVLTAMLSLVVALALVEILQPGFERLLQHPIAMQYEGAWLLSLVLIAVTAGLLSGIYPALVLSGFRPSTILHTGNAGRSGSGRLQTMLVVLQFAVSIGLGIAVMVVFSQINFARNIDLGIRKDNLLVVPGGGLVTLGGRESFVQMGCFNFTNLATARAMTRAREIALRKVVGARRVQLIVQFLGEALVTACVALLFALALTEILLPLFDRVLGLPIEVHYVRDWQLLLFIIGVSAVAGLLSGAYPALVLSAFRPAAVMRSSSGASQGAGLTRTALVVLQFAVSIGLGIAVAVIFAQISFTRNVDLGFHKEAVVDVNIGNIPPSTADSMARALRTSSSIADAAISDAVPFSDDHNNTSAHTPGATSSEQFALVPAGPEFMHVYDIKLLAGRLLSDQRIADGLTPDQVEGRDVQPANVLINATAARRLGYSPQEAVGKILILDAFGHNKLTIVGVVADIKEDGPKNAVVGTMYMYRRLHPQGHLSARIREGHMQDALSVIDRTWRSFAPSIAIQRHFLDDDYAKQFQSDERQGTLFGIFVGIAIFIACLGLFGLAAFTVGRRTREIGIRKVFGARTRDLVLLLLWQFSIPVLIANAVAWPVAWYYLHDWLQGFAYRITLSPVYFLGAGAIALAIAWATVFVHALHVARANPIHALRYE